MNNNTTPSIQAIDRRSVHRICSGQVVLDLATAVKELVENSLDACSSIVEVKLKEYGKELIEVSDNGSGISEENFEGLALKHHTSKLREFHDLTIVDTFGFRGEALSSLSALSDITITTQKNDVITGYKLAFDHEGKLTSQQRIAREKGTSVFVNNLFYTLPVRHKEFHRNFKKDFSKMCHVLYAYSLLNSNIRVTVCNIVGKKKNIILSTKGNETNSLDIITNLFGASQSKNCIEISQGNFDETVLDEYNMKPSVVAQYAGLFTISGYISSVVHGCGRSSPDRQFFFVNKRPCDFQKLSRLVNEVYHSYNHSQYPFVFLRVETNKDCVDVNVTPDKRQVLVQQEKILFALVKSSLKFIFDSTSTYYNENSNQRLSRGLQMAGLLPKDQVVPVPFESPTENSDNLMDVSQNQSLLKFKSKYDKKQSGVSPPQSEQLKLEKFFNVSVSKKRGASLTTDSDCEDGFQASPNSNHTSKRQRSSNLQNHSFENNENPHNESIQNNENVHNGNIDDNKNIHNGSIGNSENVHNGSIDNNENVHNGSIDDNKNIHNGRIDNNENVHNGSFDNNENVHNGSIETDRNNLNINDFTTKIPSANIMDTNDEQPFQESHPAHVTVQDNINNVERKCKERIVVKFDLSKFRETYTVYVNKRTKAIGGKVKGGSCVSSFRAKISPGESGAAEEELRKHVSKGMFAEMKVLGQFNLGFIIAKLKDDLFIVDQHATDEKYNFEKLQQKHVLKPQRLIQPISLEITPAQQQVLVDNMTVFERNGFDFDVHEADDDLDSRTVKLVSVPSHRNWSFGVSDVEELIFMLSDCPNVTCRPSRVRQMFASRACRTSIMVGTPLNDAAMNTLLVHMGQLDHPWNCPHGRPTMRHLVNLQRLHFGGS